MGFDFTTYRFIVNGLKTNQLRYKIRLQFWERKNIKLYMRDFMVYFDSSSRYECITYHLNIIRSILTRSWISGGCVKQQCDVGPSISLLATQTWHFEMNKVCLTFKQRLRNQWIFYSEPASFFTCFDARCR